MRALIFEPIYNLEHKNISNNGNPDPLLKLGTLFFIMFVVYYIPNIFGAGFQSVLVFWTLAFIWNLFFVRWSAWAVSAALWCPLGLAYLFGYGLDINGQASNQYLRNVLSSFVFTVSGLGILLGANRQANWDWDRINTFVHRLAAVVMAVLTVSSVNKFQADGLGDPREITGSTYLTTSDFVAMFALASIARRRIRWIDYWIVTFSSLVTLIVLGSRSAIALFSMIALLAMVRSFKFKRLFLMFILSVPPAIYWLQQFVDLDSAAFFRLSTLLNFSGSDDSLFYRGILQEQFFNQLNEAPLCLLIACHPPAGHYVHNMLSVIQYFGIIGVILLFAILASFIYYFHDIFRSKLAYVFLYCIINGVIARSWLSVIFPPTMFLLIYFTMKHYQSAVRVNYLATQNLFIKRV